MTRKKYDRDIYDEEYSSESETSDDEEIELTDEEKYNIVEYYWDPWKNTHVGQWVDPVDVEKYIHAEPKVANYQYQHLLLKGEEDIPVSLYKTILKICRDLRIPATKQKIFQVIYCVLKKRNDFCMIHRDNYHWTRRWGKKLSINNIY